MTQIRSFGPCCVHALCPKPPLRLTVACSSPATLAACTLQRHTNIAHAARDAGED
jgi:hypothetical protein